MESEIGQVMTLMPSLQNAYKWLKDFEPYNQLTVYYHMGVNIEE